MTHFSECTLVIKWSTTVSPCVYLLLNNSTEAIFHINRLFVPFRISPLAFSAFIITSKVFQCLWCTTMHCMKSSISSVSSLLEPSLPLLQSGHHACQVCLHDHFRAPRCGEDLSNAKRSGLCLRLWRFISRLLKCSASQECLLVQGLLPPDSLTVWFVTYDEGFGSCGIRFNLWRNRTSAWLLQGL